MSNTLDIIDAEFTEIQPVPDLLKQSWSEVDDLYNAIATGIVDLANNVNAAVQVLNKPKYQNNQELIVTINGLSKDMVSFTDDLVAIKERHQDMNGDVTGEDQLALYISAFTDYSILSERFRSVIFPPMLTLTEYMSEAAHDLNTTLAEEDRVDLSELDNITQATKAFISPEEGEEPNE